MNQLVPADQTSTREIGIAVGAGGASIAPQNLGEVVRFAEVMCRADIALPKHLRGNAGACMAVALQALEWQMSPFAVASKSYSVNGTIAYEAQLIAAVVNTRSGIKGRLKYEFIGSGNDLTCKVTGILDGEECTYETPAFGAITPKNSPLWKTDPRQQLGYYAARSWARRHCPEVLLGVYDREEVEHFGPDNAKDVTLSVMQRLQARQDQAPETPQTREGFDPAFVSSETSALTGQAETEHQDTSAPSADEGIGTATMSSVADPAAQISPADEAGTKDEGDNPGQVTTEQAAPSSDLSDEQKKRLFLLEECATSMFDAATHEAVSERADRLDKARMAWLSELPDDKEFVQNTYKACARLIENPAGRDQAMPFLMDQARKWMGVA